MSKLELNRGVAPVATMAISPAEIKLRLSESLRKIIGPGRPYSFAEAARKAHINERTLRAYVDGEACPNLAKYCRLLRVFGPDVGYDLALMLGWTPRGSQSQSTDIDSLNELKQEVLTALKAVEMCMKIDADDIARDS